MGQRITEETFTFPLFFKLVNEDIQSKKIENNTYFRFSSEFLRSQEQELKKKGFCRSVPLFLGRYPGGYNAELFFQSLQKCIEN